MRIRLLQSYTLKNGKRLPVGQIFNSLEGKKLIAENKAEAFTGQMPQMPPKKKDKVKTEFFKPKNSKRKWQQQEQ